MKKQNQNDSEKMVEQVNDIYIKALNETIELLKNCKTGKYIGSDEDSFEALTSYNKKIRINGVGLNDKNHICIKAEERYCKYDDVNDVLIDDYKEWIIWVDIMSDIEIGSWAYPELYRFVAENIDSATSELKTSMIFDNYKGVVLYNNKEEFEKIYKKDDTWINGCTQDFLDEHNITLEEYAEIMYKKKNKVCFNCWNCEDCYECVNCNDCHYCKNCTNCKECSFCNNCTNCQNCEWCKECTSCADCKRCENCKDCNRLCKEKSDCHNCEWFSYCDFKYKLGYEDDEKE